MVQGGSVFLCMRSDVTRDRRVWYPQCRSTKGPACCDVVVERPHPKPTFSCQSMYALTCCHVTALSDSFSKALLFSYTNAICYLPVLTGSVPKLTSVSCAILHEIKWVIHITFSVSVGGALNGALLKLSIVLAGVRLTSWNAFLKFVREWGRVTLLILQNRNLHLGSVVGGILHLRRTVWACLFYPGWPGFSIQKSCAVEILENSGKLNLAQIFSFSNTNKKVIEEHFSNFIPGYFEQTTWNAHIFCAWGCWYIDVWPSSGVLKCTWQEKQSFSFKKSQIEIDCFSMFKEMGDKNVSCSGYPDKVSFCLNASFCWELCRGNHQVKQKKEQLQHNHKRRHWEENLIFFLVLHCEQKMN